MRERAVFGRVCQRLDAVLRAYTTFPLAHCHPQRRRVVLLDLTSVNCGGDAVRVWSPSSSGVSASALDGKGQVLKTGHMETIDASDFNARCLASKDIKNLNVGVCPPNDRVRVAVLLRLGDNAVPLALISRMGWIRRQQAGFENQDRQSQRAFVTGESHFPPIGFVIIPEMRTNFVERRARLEDSDRTFDLHFWQAQSPKARFDAAWDMIVHYARVKGLDVRQLRLQRSVEAFQRQQR